MADFTITRGDTTLLDIAVTDSSGAVYNLTGASLAWTAKRDKSESTATIAKSVGSGIAVVDAAGGSATLTLSPSDTSGLAAHTTVLFWDLQLTDTSSRIFTVASGMLTVTPDVT